MKLKPGNFKKFYYNFHLLILFNILHYSFIIMDHYFVMILIIMHHNQYDLWNLFYHFFKTKIMIIFIIFSERNL